MCNDWPLQTRSAIIRVRHGAITVISTHHLFHSAQHILRSPGNFVHFRSMPFLSLCAVGMGVGRRGRIRNIHEGCFETAVIRFWGGAIGFDGSWTGDLWWWAISRGWSGRWFADGAAEGWEFGWIGHGHGTISCMGLTSRYATYKKISPIT